MKVMPIKNFAQKVCDQIESEVEVLNKLDHAYVASYTNCFKDSNYLYMMMKYFEGKEVFDWMEANDIKHEFEIATFIYKVFQGLCHVHGVGIIHRDLKPDNILVGDNGDPVIIDFGLSSDVAQKPGEAGKVGSLLFMAPEVIQGLPHSFSCDMWSIGVMLFLMLGGESPFDPMHLEKEIKETPVLFLGDTWKDVSDDAKSLILDLLNKNPFQRITA